MSRIAVFAATGLTGGLVVKHALDQEHEVVALMRDPGRLAMRHPSLSVIGGSPISAATFLLEQASSAEHLRSAPSISN